MNIEIEIYVEDGKTYVYLSHDGSSGCKYKAKDKDDIKKIIADYAADAVDYDLDLDSEDSVCY